MAQSNTINLADDVFVESVTPTEEDAELARESSRSLARLKPRGTRNGITIRVESDETEETVRIPESAFRLLTDILREMARGNAVTCIPIHAELTTQQAADILNVSRPFLIGLLENQTIKHRKVGSHRRIRFQDLMEYKRKIDQARHQTLSELTAEAQELGMGY